MTHLPRLTLALLLLGFTGCDVDIPIDEGAVTLNRITGSVLLAAPLNAQGESPAPAQVIVLVYDATNPGPPAGTGSPLTFTTVRASDFTGAAGLQSAEFAVKSLPDGTYILNALMDVDGDFNPFVTAMAGATCGDIAGTHVSDLTTLTPTTVTVSGGELVDDVTILIGSVIPFERPAFVFTEQPVMSRQLGTSAIAPQQYRLAATSIKAQFTEQTGASFPLTLDGPCPLANPAEACDANPVACTCDTTQLDPCETAFWLRLMDKDGDGELDLYPAEDQAAGGLRDIWPRVYLTWLGVPNDEGTGFVIPEARAGETWVSENYPLAVQFALGDPSVAALPLNTPIPVAELDVTWSPAFRRYHDGGARSDARGTYDLLDLRDPSVDPADVPAGAFSVTVVSFTGQTWTLPNELVYTGARDDSFVPGLQAGVLLVE